MKNVLVTGCKGQLGSEMRFMSAEYPDFSFVFTDIDELDICDKDKVNAYVNQYEIDIIVNCAAYTAVDKAESCEPLCDRLNRVAPGYLAQAVQTRGGAMIQISTDYVFDGTANVPYSEEDVPCPNTVYGRTKLAGEKMVQEFCSNSLIIRTAWLYSSYGTNFVKTMLRLGGEKKEIGVVFDQVGTPTYARDLARVIFVILTKGIIPGIYHFSNEGVISWYDFTKAIHRLAGVNTCRVYPLHSEEYPVPAARPHYSVLDKTKLKKIYGISVPYWEDSLRDCIAKLVQ